MRYLDEICAAYRIPQNTTDAFHEVVTHIRNIANITGENDVDANTKNDMELSWFFLHVLFRDGNLLDPKYVSEVTQIPTDIIMKTIEKYQYVWLEIYCNAIYVVIRNFGSALSLTRAEFVHLLFVVGRMYSSYRLHKIKMTPQEYDEVQIAAILLFFKYWKGQIFRSSDLAVCFQGKYSFAPDDFTEMEMMHLHLFLESDMPLETSDQRKWVEYERTIDLNSFFNAQPDPSAP
jgi:hypothetical protein